MREITCKHCGTAAVIGVHPGRLPEFCGDRCRAEHHKLYMRTWRRARRDELAQLRELVATMKTALAA
jgi:hypothetical protein